MKNKKPLIIANWKMKLGIADSKKLAEELKSEGSENKEIVLCPTFTSLSAVASVINKTKLKLGAQDCFWEARGAYTGEVSAEDLKELGCQYVIIGHSERRKYIEEDDEMIHYKIKTALSVDITPILCVGETFDQRQQGSTDYTLIGQTAKALGGIELKPDQRVIIAYEPVWVIGSGQAISPEEASAANEVIRQTLIDLFPAKVVERNFDMIYGGSVVSENVSFFTDKENIDGVLVGGSSLNPSEFIRLIKSV